MSSAKITWTKIDEAPALATYSLLPIVQAFVRGTGVDIETRDLVSDAPDEVMAEVQAAGE